MTSRIRRAVFALLAAVAVALPIVIASELKADAQTSGTCYFTTAPAAQATGLPTFPLCDSLNSIFVDNMAFNGTIWDRVRVDGNTSGTLKTTAGGATRTKLGATLGTCTSIAIGAVRLARVFFASAAAQTGTLTIYDEAGSPTCAAADAVYVSAAHAIATVPDDEQIPLSLGAAYAWTTAVMAGQVYATTN